MLGGPYWSILGGVSTHTKNLVFQLAQIEEIELHFITFGSETKRYTQNGIYFHELKHRFCAPFKIIIDVFLLEREILRIHPDIVHVQGTSLPYSTVVTMLRRRYTTLMTVHGLYREETRFTKEYGSYIRYLIDKMLSIPLEYFAISRIPNIIVVSPFTSRSLSFSNSNMYIIPNGVHDDFFNAKIISKLDQLLFVGTVAPIKGIFNLIKLMEKLVKDKGLKMKLNIVGPIPFKKYFNYINSYIEANNLTSYIHFTGFVPPKELVQIFMECTIFVFPTRFETFGIVLLQAMACGKPVVASNIGGVPFIVDDGETGFLFECDNVDDLAEKVVTLLNDVELRKKMGRKGRKKAKEFTWENIAKRTFLLYNKIHAKAK